MAAAMPTEVPSGKKSRCDPGSRSASDDERTGETPLPPIRGGKLPTFKVLASAGYDTAYEVVRALEKGPLKGKLVSIRPLTTGGLLLSPKDYHVVQILEQVTELNGKPVTITKLLPEQKQHRLVIHDFPVSYGMDCITELPTVIAAKRLCRWNKTPTNKVLIIVKGNPFNTIDLGIWGRHDVRTYIPDPLRCFRCQNYGHHQARCRAPKPRCGICSQPHTTDLCLTKFKAGTETQAKCPNCGKKHHAWNIGCSVRKAQSVICRERTEKREDFIPAPPGTYVWGSKRHSPPAPPKPKESVPDVSNQENFPALPQETNHPPPSPPKPTTQKIKPTTMKPNTPPTPSTQAQGVQPPPPQHPSDALVLREGDLKLIVASVLTGVSIALKHTFSPEEAEELMDGAASTVLRVLSSRNKKENTAPTPDTKRGGSSSSSSSSSPSPSSSHSSYSTDSPSSPASSAPSSSPSSSQKLTIGETKPKPKRMPLATSRRQLKLAPPLNGDETSSSDEEIDVLTAEMKQPILPADREGQGEEVMELDRDQHRPVQ